MLLIAAAVGFGAIVLAHVAPFPFLLEALRPERSLWHGPPTPESRGAGGAHGPVVYLTYDDGPNPAATPRLLDVLRREGVRATFFVIDDHLTEETAPIVRQMFADGHAVALHSSARWLMLLEADALADVLRRAASRIERLAGAPPCRLFRPHAGWRSGAMYAALDRIGYRLAGWSWGLWDWDWWRARNPERLAARLARRANAGDVIVMHDGHHRDPRADREYAVEATARLIPALRARGLRVSRLPCAS